jgi:hypothetical protein
MPVIDVLDKAQGGQLFRKLGEFAGLAPSDAKRAVEALCPSIAARLHEKAREADEFQRLLDLLEDNDSDILVNGDPASADVRDDGRTVLTDLYGSQEAALKEAIATAQALRIDKSAVEQLQPIAASLVLAVLSTRYRQVDEAKTEAQIDAQAAREVDGARNVASGKGSIIGIVFAAIGAAVVRGLMNRLMPRRRRRTAYSYGTRRRTRRSRRYQPRLEDLFRDLMR